MMSSIEAYAYFYPQTTTCTERAMRAQSLGYKLCNEPAMVQSATSLFKGHDQPKTYCLGDAAETEWDDSNASTICKQIELARQYGIKGFIFDTYGGFRGGRPVHESSLPFEIFKSLTSERRNFNFANLWVMSGPRVILPVPRSQSMAREPSQSYDVSLETARFIVDSSIGSWEDPNYLHINGRPYCAIMPSTLSRHDTSVESVMFFDEIREYAHKKYRITPYLVGIERRENFYAELYQKVGVDAVSAYALLPDFESGAAPIQDYVERRDKVYGIWERMRGAGVNFMPPAVVGWDASPRGEAGATFEDVACKYPFTPILTGNTAENFGDMLRAAAHFVQQNNNHDQKIVPICAFNEVGEGCSLLPRVVDGKADFSLLRMVRSVMSESNIRDI